MPGKKIVVLMFLLMAIVFMFGFALGRLVEGSSPHLLDDGRGPGIVRYEDPEAQVICYLYVGIGVDCLPMKDTDY